MFKNNNNIIFRQFENILFFEIFKCYVLGLNCIEKLLFGLGLNFSYRVWLGLGYTLRNWFGLVLKFRNSRNFIEKLWFRFNKNLTAFFNTRIQNLKNRFKFFNPKF